MPLQTPLFNALSLYETTGLGLGVGREGAENLTEWDAVQLCQGGGLAGLRPPWHATGVLTAKVRVTGNEDWFRDLAPPTVPYVSLGAHFAL